MRSPKEYICSKRTSGGANHPVNNAQATQEEEQPSIEDADYYYSQTVQLNQTDDCANRRKSTGSRNATLQRSRPANRTTGDEPRRSQDRELRSSPARARAQAEPGLSQQEQPGKAYQDLPEQAKLQTIWSVPTQEGCALSKDNSVDLAHSRPRLQNTLETAGITTR